MHPNRPLNFALYWKTEGRNKPFLLYWLGGARLSGYYPDTAFCRIISVIWPELKNFLKLPKNFTNPCVIIADSNATMGFPSRTPVWTSSDTWNPGDPYEPKFLRVPKNFTSFPLLPLRTPILLLVENSEFHTLPTHHFVPLFPAFFISRPDEPEIPRSKICEISLLNRKQQGSILLNSGLGFLPRSSSWENPKWVSFLIRLKGFRFPETDGS